MIELELELNPGELDPIEGLARIAANKLTPLDVRVDCLKSMAPYMYPKLANVAVRGDPDGPPIKTEVVNIERFLLDPSLVAAAQQVALAMEDEDQRQIDERRKPLALPAPAEFEFEE